MKKFKLMLVAFMAMMGVDAFAAVTPGTYTYTKDGLTYECTVATGGVADGAVLVGRSDDAAYATTTAFEIPVDITPTGATGAWNDPTTPLKFDVVGIKPNAFKGDKVITTFTFKTGSKLEEIGANAFDGSAITAITLPATVKTIGKQAFANTAISALVIPEALTTIGEAFIEGTNITELDFTPAAAGFKQAGIADNAFASEKLQKVIFYTKSGSTVKENSVTKIIGPNTTGPVTGWFTNSFALKEVVFPTTLVEIEASAFQNTVLTTLDLSKSAAAVTLSNMFNAKKTAPFSTLKSVSFPDLAAQTIPTNAFAYCTGLTTLTFPTKWVQGTTSQVDANAFLACTGITGVTFKPVSTTWATTTGNVPVFDDDAFKSCTATITIATISQYSSVWTTAPTNCEYGTYVNEGVEITLTSGFALLARDKAYMVNPDDATVYQVYVDDATTDADGTIYMVPFKVASGFYQVSGSNVPVVIKAKDSSAAKIKIYEDAGASTSSWAATRLQRSAKDATESVSKYATGTQYVNVAAISGGKFGFTSPSGTTLAPKTYFVLSKKQYGAAGARIVWLDEEEATAIMGVKKAAKENGAIYNLAGQKVNASYKGVVIKNGKKYIQK